VDDQLWNAPCAFVAFTDDGHILETNERLLKMLGCAKSDLVGRHIEQFLTLPSRIFYQTHFFPLLALHGNAEEILMTLRSQAGESIPVLAYAARDASGNRCIFVPVHQRQKYEEELLAARRAAEDAARNSQELLAAKSELQQHTRELGRRIASAEQKNGELLQVTRILFHDLREPIRKIETFGSILAEEPGITPESRASLAKIHSACERMNRLLRALQEFVSVETKDEKPALTDLANLVDDAYRSVSRKYPEAAATFRSEGLVPLEGYPRQLSTMFAQLLDNAFKFRRPDVPLEITIRGTVVQENSLRNVRDRYEYVDCIQIFFHDNGRGIAEDYRDSAFDLLTRLDIRNPQPGCGLAICKKVTENHFGSISVVPNEREGTTFKILLPLQQK
jgi:phosphoserine phosphatase RsbU/P